MRNEPVKQSSSIYSQIKTKLHGCVIVRQTMRRYCQVQWTSRNIAAECAVSLSKWVCQQRQCSHTCQWWSCTEARSGAVKCAVLTSISHAAQPSTNLTSRLSVSYTSPVHQPSQSNCPQTHKPMKSSVNWAWRQPAAVGQFHSCSSYLLLALIISWHAPAIPHPHPTPATAHCASARPPARLTQWLCSSTQTHINTSAQVSIRHRREMTSSADRQSRAQLIHSAPHSQSTAITHRPTRVLSIEHRTANSVALT